MAERHGFVLSGYKLECVLGSRLDEVAHAAAR
jgi:hypothetical protein